MIWLVVYLIGAVVMLTLCGVAFGADLNGSRLTGSIIIAAMWPILLPVIVGALIREVGR